jgi:AAA+ ATPase superfamily predicted ATPase
MFTILDKKENVIALQADKKVKSEDYEQIIPVLDAMIEQYGKIRCLAEISGIDGIEPEAFWDDLKFSLKHTNDFEKVAIVGSKPFIKAITKFSTPFTKADVKTFDKNEVVEAIEWLAA